MFNTRVFPWCWYEKYTNYSFLFPRSPNSNRMLWCCSTCILHNFTTLRTTLFFFISTCRDVLNNLFLVSVWYFFQVLRYPRYLSTNKQVCLCFLRLHFGSMPTSEILVALRCLYTIYNISFLLFHTASNIVYVVPKNNPRLFSSIRYTLFFNPSSESFLF